MARFAIGQTVTTDQPTVVVDAGLPAGSHRFRLVVVDMAGNTSRPDEVLVVVQAISPITPVTPVTPVSPVTPVTPVVPVRPAGAAPTASRPPPRSTR